jgi:hypothetical protein
MRWEMGMNFQRDLHKWIGLLLRFLKPVGTIRPSTDGMEGLLKDTPP